MVSGSRIFVERKVKTVIEPSPGLKSSGFWSNNQSDVDPTVENSKVISVMVV